MNGNDVLFQKVTQAYSEKRNPSERRVEREGELRSTKKAGVVYKIPCSQCEKIYIGETGRQLGTRITEHRKEAEKISNRNCTRTTRRASTNEHHKSAITDHVCQTNHIMNWEASEIVEQESDKLKRWIKESICIRSNTPTMNSDKGAYQLSPIWTQVISTPKPGGRGRLQSDFAHLSQ